MTFAPLPPRQTAAEAAQEYARRGWHVFPAPPGRKQSYLAAADHDGRRWGASDDPETVAANFRAFPSANVGIATQESGLVVLDLDRKDERDGIVWLAGMIEKHGPLPDTIEAGTPSGGRHLYFRAPAGVEIKTCEGEVAPGVDVRAWGGMVIAPPSAKPGAAEPYHWRNPPGLFDLAEAPEWLLALLPRRDQRKLSERATAASFRIDTGETGWADAALRGEIAAVLSAPEGQRNAQLNRSAFNLGQIVAGGGLIEALVRDRLTGAAQAAGLDAGEIEKTIASGLTKGMESPREAPERDRRTPGSTAPICQIFNPATRWAGKPVPPREWHVEPLVPAHQVTMLGGEPGTGKSLLAKQLAAATAAGTRWLGRAVDRPGPALYLSAEDDEDELHRRFADICDAEGLGLSDLGDLYARSMAGDNALLAIPGPERNVLAETELYNRLDAEIGDRRATLVVLDTLADLHAGDEVNRAHARQFIGMMRHLGIRHSASILLLAHPSLTGINSGSGLSGSTGWGASVRSRLYLERIIEDGFEPDPDVRRLVGKKANYARNGEEIAMRWQMGRFVADTPPGGLDRLAAHAKADRVFLKLLDEFNAEGRHVRHTTGHGYAPTVFAKSGRAEGVSKRELDAAMERLFANGTIRIEEDGPPSKRVRRIARGEK